MSEYTGYGVGETEVPGLEFGLRLDKSTFEARLTDVYAGKRVVYWVGYDGDIDDLIFTHPLLTGSEVGERYGMYIDDPVSAHPYSPERARATYDEYYAARQRSMEMASRTYTYRPAQSGLFRFLGKFMHR